MTGTGEIITMIGTMIGIDGIGIVGTIVIVNTEDHLTPAPAASQVGTSVEERGTVMTTEDLGTETLDAPLTGLTEKGTITQILADMIEIHIQMTY